ncbi:MAG: DUF4426 domain-containing protein [Halioglobus sp.]|nr:DUF4426 domain-containing protein [Halioglobus sp.]
MLLRIVTALLGALWLSTTALAEQSEMFGPFELHYSVVNTTFLEPEVAATYGITRGKKRAILNLAVREHVGQGTAGRTMLLKGRTWDLIHEQPLQFMEVREGDAIYYIAEFTFINEEFRFFEMDFRPEGAQQTYTFKFKHQLYIN